MMSKWLYRSVKEIAAFPSYLKFEMEEMAETVSPEDQKNFQGYYNKQATSVLKEYLEMNLRTESHVRWMKTVLKDFSDYWKDAEKDITNQEDLLEDRDEFMTEVLESRKERDENFYDLMIEQAQEWKDEFKN